MDSLEKRAGMMVQMSLEDVVGLINQGVEAFAEAKDVAILDIGGAKADERSLIWDEVDWRTAPVQQVFGSQPATAVSIVTMSLSEATRIIRAGKWEQFAQGVLFDASDRVTRTLIFPKLSP